MVDRVGVLGLLPDLVPEVLDDRNAVAIGHLSFLGGHWPHSLKPPSVLQKLYFQTCLRPAPEETWLKSASVQKHEVVIRQLRVDQPATLTCTSRCRWHCAPLPAPLLAPPP